MKRTKRYGGFLVGDRVMTKVKYDLGKGMVVDMRNGFLVVRFDGRLELGFMPNQLINLTRFEDDEEYKMQIANKILENVEGMIESNAERLCTLFPFKAERKLPTIHFSPSDCPKEEESTQEQIANNIEELYVGFDEDWKIENGKIVKEGSTCYTITLDKISEWRAKAEKYDNFSTLYDQLCSNIDVWCDTLKQQLKERIDEFKSSL